MKRQYFIILSNHESTFVVASSMAAARKKALKGQPEGVTLSHIGDLGRVF